MCGIAGYQGDFERDLIHNMNQAQSYRGPDGVGVYSDGDVSLGHVRLSILDLSEAAAQPMKSHDGRYALTYNGEIYNYRELREELIQKGVVFTSTGDTEVLLKGLIEYGYDFVERLNGIFALALWDKKEKKLFLVRDGLGVKPLYYTECDQGFLFASEIKALLKCASISRGLDLHALHYYLAYLWCPAPRTSLKAVKKLEPGEAIVVSEGRIVRRWHFYDLPYGQTGSILSERHYEEELVSKLESAVRRQMISDVPVGAFLSGGLDSSAVVAMMRKLNENGHIRCYSIGFEGDEDVEGNPADLPYARKVAHHLNVDLQTIEVKPNMIEHLPRMLYHLDEPQADPAPINALLIAERARQDGIKVLMSGAGGDDIFTGYRRHLALRKERWWTWLPHPMKKSIAAKAREWLGGGSKRGWADRSLSRRLMKLMAYVDHPLDERLVSYFYWGSDDLRRSLYSSDVAAVLANSDTAEPLMNSLMRIKGERDPINRMLYLEGKHFLADHNLNYTDKVSMAAGVEVRVPLIDLEMVEFATRIPSRLKQKGSVGKSIFKRAMRSHLPHDVIYRKKSGFGAPLRRWLHKELRPVVEDVLSMRSLSNRGLFDPGAVQRLVASDRRGVVDSSYTIFSLMCIELWCRMFIDGQEPQTLWGS